MDPALQWATVRVLQSHSIAYWADANASAVLAGCMWWRDRKQETEGGGMGATAWLYIAPWWKGVCQREGAFSTRTSVIYIAPCT